MPRARLSGTEHDKKYGWASGHRHERAAWQRRLDAGELVTCWRCGRPVDPRHWQLGHRDHLGLPSHPEHPRCNMSAGGRLGNAVKNGRARRPAAAPTVAAERAHRPRCEPCPATAANGDTVCEYGTPRRPSGGPCW